MTQSIKLLSSISLVLVCLVSRAQDLKLAGIEYLSYPKVKFKDDASGNQAAFNEAGAFISFPKLLQDKKTILVNGIQYGMVQTSIYNDALSSKNEMTFHKVSYSFTYIRRFNEKWTFIGRLSPTLASDFEDKLSWHDFILQGNAMITKKFNENVVGGAGLIYTMRFGKPLLFPSIQYQYKKDSHALNIYLPIFVNYTYQTGPENKVGLGFRATVNGANFNASSKNFSSDTEMDRFNYARANIGPFVNYQLTKTLLIEASGGLSTMRMYQFEDLEGSKHKYDSESGGFFNIGIVLLPPRPKKQLAAEAQE